MDRTHDRVATPWRAQYVRERRTRAAAHRDGHVPEGRTHAQAVATTDRDQGRKPLGKNTPRTGGVPAEEATNLQMQEEPCPGKRQVDNRAPIGTTHRSRTVLAARTRGGALPAAEVNLQDATHPTMGPQPEMGEMWQEH
jgi:hypothetical protein